MAKTWILQEVEFYLASKCIAIHYHGVLSASMIKYSKIPLLRSPDIKTTLLLRTPFSSPKLGLPNIFISVIMTTPLIRPLLDSPKGGLNIGILLYWIYRL